MRKNHVFSLSFILLLFSGAIAFAKPTTYSNSEDVAMAFYKMGDIAPDFTKWIETTSPYVHTPWAKRKDVMKEERARLFEKFMALEPEKTDIRIQTKVTLDAVEVLEEIEENIVEPIYFLNMNFLNGDDVMYFPFTHAEQNFALMPFGLNKILKTAITKSEYDFYKDTLIPKRAYYLIINMRAKESVITRPIVMDGIDQWVLKTNIASSEIWNDKGGLVWEYTAPWYTSPKLEELQNIYDLKKEDFSSFNQYKFNDPDTSKKQIE